MKIKHHKFNPYPYQRTTLNNIVLKLREGVRSLVTVLPTGGGKTVIFTLLTEYYKAQGKRVLILVNRAELAEQTSKGMENSFLVYSGDKTTVSDKPVTVAMVETINNILHENPAEGEAFDVVIMDECHVMVFDKIWQYLPDAIRLGFTATPIIEHKIEYLNKKEQIVRRPVTLKHFYEDIVVGCQASELIEQGYLVKEKNYVLKLAKFGGLKTTKDGLEYTKDSLTAVYSSQTSIDTLIKAYVDLCKGKKTVIFNSNTKVNILVEKALKEIGVDCRSYDSVNNSKKERESIVKWFKDGRDRVLINTNVFTTGFDVDDIEMIILNRATKSLSLYIQMVGRGSRTTKKIDKKLFGVIDLGGNIKEHGAWSMDRDWLSHFNQTSRQRRKSDLKSVWFCEVCDYINEAHFYDCDDCGTPKESAVKEVLPKRLRDGEIVEVTKPNPPSTKRIVDYICRNGSNDVSLAFQILDTQFIDMLIRAGIGKTEYYKDDRLEKRIIDIQRTVYFGLLGSKLTGANKKLSTLQKRLKTKISKYYEV